MQLLAEDLLISAGILISVSVVEYLIALLVLAIGGGVQATLGIGAGLVAGPALTVIDPALVPGPLLAMGMVVTVRNSIGDRQSTDLLAWRRALLGAPVGLAFGVLVLSYIDADALSLVIGCFVLASVGLQVGGLRPPKGVVANYLAGTATAFSSTVAALPGPMFVIFHGHRTPGAVRGTLACFMLVITPAILALLAFDGRFGPRHILLATVLTPGMFLGLALGKVLRPRVAAHRFRAVILTVASLSAIAVIIRALAS